MNNRKLQVLISDQAKIEFPSLVENSSAIITITKGELERIAKYPFNITKEYVNQMALLLNETYKKAEEIGEAMAEDAYEELQVELACDISQYITKLAYYAGLTKEYK